MDFSTLSPEAQNGAQALLAWLNAERAACYAQVEAAKAECARKDSELREYAAKLEQLHARRMADLDAKERLLDKGLAALNAQPAPRPSMFSTIGR